MNVIVKYLFDIQSSIQTLKIHLSSIADFTAFERNITVKRAVERELEIIGEAVKRIIDTDNAINITDSRKIIALRNRIIHGYDSVDDAVIWNVIVNNIPLLQKEVENLIELSKKSKE
ncbi:MAG: DUF86 domain-containing protein [Brevinematales bacterium]|nr:DUF86 domain-containing protein [Brevinematales bacterium]